uniref:Transcription factor A, mitochondrial n=1 Tax=Rhipicephalus appendiculatus TaxID=34631 RepID=A0A131Z1Q2_RHIAP
MFRVWLSFRDLSTKVSFPSRPKRLSGYNLFVKTIWPSLKQENPGKDFQKVAFIAAKKWKAVDEHTKQLYANEARDIMAQQEKQYNEYLSSLNIEEIMATGQKAKHLHLRTKNRRLEAKLRQLKKPRLPRSAYAFFCIEARQPNQKLTEEAKVLAEKWKALSESEKQVYQRRAEEDKRRYNDDMIDWEMCMQQSGNSEILQKYFQERNTVEYVKKHLVKRLTQCEESLGG